MDFCNGSTMQNFQLRLNQVIKEEVANLILKNLSDNLLITITSVISNKDGSKADIYFVIYPNTDENIDKCKSIIETKKTEIQNIIGKKHKLRRTPVFNFCYDKEYNITDNIEKALKEINEERS